MQEAERANKRSSTISSRKDTTREFRKLYGSKKAHKVTFKDVESIVFKNLKNGNKPSSQTIKNRWSGIRALMNRAISKGYLRKDGNPCETYNGFSELPSSTPNKNFLTVSQTQALIKNATEYKDGIMLAYFSLACFSGLRPHEIHGDAFRSPKDCDPLIWNDIDLNSDNPEIFVSEEQAKTRVTRWAPLGDHNMNLRILLNYAKGLGHDLITTKNFKENWRAVVKLSELSFEGSDADSPRRSFATYLHNKNRTIADKELSRIMGNSPYVLNKHYKTIIQSGEGKKYFRIGPSGLLLDENQLLTEKDREIKRLQNLWKGKLGSYAKKDSLDF
jgi:integrase